MADIGKPLSRGPGVRLPQPRGPGRQSGVGGRRQSSLGASTQHQSANDAGHDSASRDSFAAGGANPKTARTEPGATLAARGQSAAMPTPDKFRGSGPTLLRAPAQSARMQSTQEAQAPRSAGPGGAPQVLHLAIAQMMRLHASSGLQGGDAEMPTKQAALTDMIRLLRQPAAKEGLTQAQAREYTQLAHQANVASDDVVMAAAAYLGSSAQSPAAFDPAKMIHGIQAHRVHTASSRADEAMHDGEAHHLRAQEQDSAVRAKDSSKKAESSEQRAMSHGSEINARVQDARQQQRRQAARPQSATARIAEEEKAKASADASFRGQTTAKEALSAEDLQSRNRKLSPGNT